MPEVTQDQFGLFGGVLIGLALLFSLLRGASSIMNIISVLMGAATATFFYTSGSEYVTDVLGDSQPITKFIGAGVAGVVVFFFSRFIGVLFLARFFKMLFGAKMRKLLPVVAICIGGCVVKNLGSKPSSSTSSSEQDSQRDLKISNPYFKQASSSQNDLLNTEAFSETLAKVKKMGNSSETQKKFSLFEVRYFFSNLLYKAKSQVLAWTGNSRNDILVEDQYRFDVIKLRGILMSEDKSAIGVEYERVLRSPGVQKLLQDRRVVRALVRADYDELYRNPHVKEYIESPFNQVLLDEVKW